MLTLGISFMVTVIKTKKDRNVGINNEEHVRKHMGFGKSVPFPSLSGQMTAITLNSHEPFSGIITYRTS